VRHGTGRGQGATGGRGGERASERGGPGPGLVVRRSDFYSQRVAITERSQASHGEGTASGRREGGGRGRAGERERERNEEQGEGEEGADGKTNKWISVSVSGDVING